MRDYLRARHICLVTDDLAKARADLEDIFTLDLAYIDPEVDVFEIENALYPVGYALLELAAPTAETAAVTRFLRSSGGEGGYVIAFHCSDPAARNARANALGIRTIAELDYTHGNFHAFQLHPKDCGGVMLEFDHTTGGEALLGPSYAAGGKDWPKAVNTTQTLGFTEVVMAAKEPLQRGAQYAALLGQPLQQDARGAVIEMDLFSVRFVQARPEQRDSFVGIGLRVKDPEAVLAKAKARGYLVEGQGFSFCGVRLEIV